MRSSAFGGDLTHRPLVQVNNAGIARGKTILDTKPEEFLLTYKVNVLGAHNILREFLPHCKTGLKPLLYLVANSIDITVVKIKCVERNDLLIGDC